MDHNNWIQYAGPIISIITFLAAVVGMIVGFTKQREETNHKIADLEEKFCTLAKELQEEKEQNKENYLKHESKLEEQAQEQSRRIQAIVSEFHETIENMQQQLQESFNKTISEFTNGLNTKFNKIAEIEEKVDLLNTSVKVIEEKITTMRADTAELKEDVKSIQTKVTQLDTRTHTRH